MKMILAVAVPLALIGCSDLTVENYGDSALNYCRIPATGALSPK